MKAENFYKKVLKNGLTVLFEKRRLPVVSVATAVKFGSEYEEEKTKGIAHFIEHLVFKGTKKRSQEEISAEIEKKGGILNAFTSEEVTAFWNKLPSNHLDLGLDITSDLTLNPLFKQEEVDRERKVILEEIKMYHDNPMAHSVERIKEMLYSKPFGMFGAGTAESMERITRKDILNSFDSFYTTNRKILCVVGKGEFDDICGMAEKTFPKTKKEIQEKIPVKINGEKIEKRKGIDQAHFCFGYHCSSLQEKQKYAYELFNTYLGVGMSSRLFQEIREKRGLAYATKGFLEINKNFGYGFFYIGTLKEKIKQVKKLILEEIKKIQKLEKKDLGEVKEQLIGLRKVASEDSQETMIGLIADELDGKAEDYYNYEEKLKEIKLEDMRELGKLKSYSSFALVPD